jgi:Fe-S-cluster containining protein
MDRPKLREGVRILEEKDGKGTRWVIEDETLGFRLVVNRDLFTVARRFDGETDLTAVKKALANAGYGVSSQQIKNLVRFLDSYYLLENPRGRRWLDKARAHKKKAEQAGETERPEPPRVHVLKGSRFSCVSCGYCCAGHLLIGPIQAKEKEAISSLPIWKTLPGIESPADLFIDLSDEEEPPTEKKPTGVDKIYMAVRGKACAFLTDENRCRIHEEYGEAAKPYTCRAFPFRVVKCPDGYAASLRYECKSMDRGIRDGRPLEEQIEFFRDLARLRRPAHVPPLIPIRPLVNIPYNLLLKLEARALGLIDDAPTPEEALLALRDLVFSLSARIPDLPDEEDYRRAAKALEEDPGERRAAEAREGGAAERRDLESPEEKPGEGKDISQRPLPDPVEFKRALTVLVADLAELTLSWFLMARRRPTPRTAQFLLWEQFAVPLFSLLWELDPEKLNELGPVPRFNPDRLTPVSYNSGDPDIRAFYRGFLKNEIFGKSILLSFSVTFGYAVLALRYILIRWSSRIHAAGRKSQRVELQDVVEASPEVNHDIGDAPAQQTLARNWPTVESFFRNLTFEKDTDWEPSA